MSKKRYVDTNFWEDSYTANLDPSEKLIFLYLLTNSCTNIAGVYQITLKRIACDTGIDRDMVLKILERFKKDKKIDYIDGWMLIKNFIKHQNLNSHLIVKGIENELLKVPDYIKEGIWYISDIDTPSNKHLNQDINKDQDKDKNQDKDKIKIKIPTLEDCREYAIEKNLNIDVDFFYKYFSEGNWHDSKGAKVKSWKQKMLTWNNFNANKTQQKPSVNQTPAERAEEIRRLCEEA
jgi:hypothetical protein